MPFIRECIVSTIRDDSSIHIAPMGIHEDGENLIILPFKPSTTLDNLERNHTATLNYTDDVRVYAGCITDHRDWPTCATDVIKGARLENCLAHTELEVVNKEDDELRPKYTCKVVHEATHQAFHGYNRAQFAVLELAILTSRLKMLPKEKIQQEIEYLEIGYIKTSGPREQEAWGWLMNKIKAYQAKGNQT
ncbi:MAG: DUF447 domain-containing protein [Pseudomonadota bacterium]